MMSPSRKRSTIDIKILALDYRAWAGMGIGVQYSILERVQALYIAPSISIRPSRLYPFSFSSYFDAPFTSSNN